MHSLLLLMIFSASAAHAAAVAGLDIVRCERIKAEFQEMEKLKPIYCDESKSVHLQYRGAYLEIFETCKRLETRATAGAPKLTLGTEDEMRSEAMAIRQKDLEERLNVKEHVAHVLLLTPIDTDSPARPPAIVSDECRTELDEYSKVRRATLSVLSRLFQLIETADETLFQQASDRALPKGTAPKRDVASPRPVNAITEPPAPGR